MRVFTSVYILLLCYIIAAIVFWEISLQKQSGTIYAQQVITLQNQVDSVHFPELYNEQLALLKTRLNTRTNQYVAEGTTFLIVILIGAVVVFKSIIRRFKLSRQQNNFMLSVTHELKSPIAAMKLNLQTLEKHQLDEEKRKMLVDRCIKESNRLNDLCNNLLLASQIEGRQYRPVIEQFDFSEMVEQAARDYDYRFPRKFILNITPGSMLTGDRVMLQIAINNLLENAIKYTPADKPVEVVLEKNHAMVVVKVKDQGPGIPDSEKKRIFDKFYRVGNEESRLAKGTGLGLYLTHKIIMQHKGRIIVKDNTPSGSIFEICLPL